MNNIPSKIAQQLAIPSQASTSTRNTVTSMNHIPIDSRPVTMSVRPTIPSILEPELRPELGVRPSTIDPKPLKPAPLDPIDPKPLDPIDPKPLKPAPLDLPALDPPPSEFSFSTTKNPIEKPPIKNTDIFACVSIFHTGKNVNSKYSYPSQFPNLTKSHSLTKTIKGGKRKKMNKKSEKNIKCL